VPDKTESLQQILNIIKTWIESESGPTLCEFHDPELSLKVKMLGWKKIILERKFGESPKSEGKGSGS
jgi:hypothetical protein